MTKTQPRETTTFTDPLTPEWDDEVEVETCEWCDQPLAADDGTDYCNRLGMQLHPRCHYESECRCRA